MPDYNSSVPNRLTILETRLQHYSEDLVQLSEKIDGLDAKFDLLNTNMALLIDQRDKSEKALSRWKTLALSVAGGLAVALIAFLAKVCWVVQSSKLTSF